MHILIAEDERELANVIIAVLRKNNYEVTHAQNGAEAVEFAALNIYDCMVFDIMMPRMSGIEALTKIRDANDKTPVIMLTAKAEIEDKVDGLDAGADDYLTKPFSMKELLARIRSLTRRTSTYTPKKLKYGSVCLDTEILELSSKNSIRLAQKESRLMEYLMSNPEKELSTENILSKIWKDEDCSEGIVWVYISYLRDKLKSIHADIQIYGERGSNYKLVESQVTT